MSLMAQGIMFQRARSRVLDERGWRRGTDLEDQVALLLSRFSWSPTEVMQQYKVDRYRLDFAWPHVQVAIEADGWWHRSPEGAARDASRDSYLRGLGWLVFRVDDRGGPKCLADQVARVSRFLRREE